MSGGTICGAPAATSIVVWLSAIFWVLFFGFSAVLSFFVLRDVRRSSTGKASGGKGFRHDHRGILYRCLVLSRVGAVYDIVTGIFSVVSVVIFILDTYETASFADTVLQVDVVLANYFICSWVINLYAFPDRVEYLLSIEPAIDILSSLPVYFQLCSASEWGTSVQFLRTAKIWRMTRMIRVFRMLRPVGIIARDMFTNVTQARVFQLLSWFTICVIIVSGFVQVFAEFDAVGKDTLPWEIVEGTNMYFHDAFYFVMTTITTVGFGDISPVSARSRLIIACMLLSVISIVPYQMSKVSELMSMSSRARSSQVSSEWADHHLVIVCDDGSVSAVEDIIRQTFHNDRGLSTALVSHIVVLLSVEPGHAWINLASQYPRRITLLAGDAMSVKDLQRCQLSRAMCVFILADMHSRSNNGSVSALPSKHAGTATGSGGGSGGAYAQDKVTLRRALAVRNYSNYHGSRSPIYIQVFSEEYWLRLVQLGFHPRHLVCFETLLRSLVTGTCLCPGISTIIQNAVSTVSPDEIEDKFKSMQRHKEQHAHGHAIKMPSGTNHSARCADYVASLSNEFYRIPLGALFPGQPFKRVSLFVYTEYGMTVIALGHRFGPSSSDDNGRGSIGGDGDVELTHRGSNSSSADEQGPKVRASFSRQRSQFIDDFNHDDDDLILGLPTHDLELRESMYAIVVAQDFQECTRLCATAPAAYAAANDLGEEQQQQPRPPQDQGPYSPQPSPQTHAHPSPQPAPSGRQPTKQHSLAKLYIHGHAPPQAVRSASWSSLSDTAKENGNGKEQANCRTSTTPETATKATAPSSSSEMPPRGLDLNQARGVSPAVVDSVDVDLDIPFATGSSDCGGHPRHIVIVCQALRGVPVMVEVIRRSPRGRCAIVVLCAFHRKDAAENAKNLEMLAELFPSRGDLVYVLRGTDEEALKQACVWDTHTVIVLSHAFEKSPQHGGMGQDGGGAETAEDAAMSICIDVFRLVDTAKTRVVIEFGDNDSLYQYEILRAHTARSDPSSKARFVSETTARVEMSLVRNRRSQTLTWHRRTCLAPEDPGLGLTTSSMSLDASPLALHRDALVGEHRPVDATAWREEITAPTRKEGGGVGFTPPTGSRRGSSQYQLSSYFRMDSTVDGINHQTTIIPPLPEPRLYESYATGDVVLSSFTQALLVSMFFTPQISDFLAALFSAIDASDNRLDATTVTLIPVLSLVHKFAPALAARVADDGDGEQGGVLTFVELFRVLFGHDIIAFGLRRYSESGSHTMISPAHGHPLQGGDEIYIIYHRSAEDTDTLLNMPFTGNSAPGLKDLADQSCTLQDLRRRRRERPRDGSGEV